MVAVRCTHANFNQDYADNVDARQYDQRLRGPVMPEELAIDLQTGNTRGAIVKLLFADELKA